MTKNAFTALVIFVLMMSVEALSAGSSSPGPSPPSFKSKTCRSDFGSYPVSDGSSQEVMAGFLRAHLPNLQNKQTAIQLSFSQVSPGGYHYTFCQTYSGIPVFASEVTVSVSRKNRVYSIFDDSYDMSGWNVNMADFKYQDVAAYGEWMKEYFTGPSEVSARQVVAWDAAINAPQLCYELTVRDAGHHMRYALVSRDGIVYESDGLRYHHKAATMLSDSTVTGMVNNPDPLTTAGVLYWAPYMGQDSAYQNFQSADGELDSCVVQLDTQRVRKTFTADFVNDTFYLSSHYINLANPEGEGFTPAISVTPNFDFDRCESGFNDVMVFYHLNTIRSHVHDCGYNAADTPITADPHFYAQDESFFEEPNNVFYGTGGVPDAEDADVIVHEYTHFISWNANHSDGFGASEQRQGIDEGSGDYDAGSYSASIDTFHWYWVFNWDGHNEYWPGRWLNETAVYPDLPTDVQGIWQYGSIWSSSLMQIWWAIGRGPADSLFYEALYGLGSNIALPDAARQYIAADSLLFNGLYHCTIVDIFNQHGLLYTSVSSAPGDSLIASPAGGNYQWLLNGQPIPGATSQVLVATSLGDYSVTINYWPCAEAITSTSVPSPLGIQNISEQGISVWPNPFTDHIDIKLGDMSSAQIEIYTVLGSKVISGTYQNQASIDMSALSSGVYVVHIMNDQIDATRMINKY